MTIPLPSLSSLGGRSSSKSRHASRESVKKRLRAISDLPTNRVCSDCPEREPTWASLQVGQRVGVLCCYRCYSHHFQLGKDVCKVKNIKMPDEWTAADLETLERGGGNDIVNFIYEAGLSSAVYDKMAVKEDPEDDAAARKEFIRLKYEELRYFDDELYKTQISQQPALVQSNGVMVRPTKKTSKRSKSFEPAPEPSSLMSFAGKSPIRRCAKSFGATRYGGGRDEEDEDSEMGDSSRNNVGYSLPGHLGAVQGAKQRSLLDSSCSSSSRSRTKKKRAPSREGKRRGSSKSKYLPMQDDSDPGIPSKEDLGYGSDSSRGSRSSIGSNSSSGKKRLPPRGRNRSGSNRRDRSSSIGMPDSSIASHQGKDASLGSCARRLSNRGDRRRRSSSAMKYLPMSDAGSPSNEDLGYGPSSNAMDVSMESITASGKARNLPGRERRWSLRSTASTAASSLPSSLSTFGNSETGRWDESSLLAQSTNASSWNTSQNHDSNNSLDRWGTDHAARATCNGSQSASERGARTISNRWGTDSESLTSESTSEREARSMPRPKPTRRRSQSTGGSILNKATGRAPRKPCRVVSGSSGEDSELEENDRSQRAPIKKDDIESKQTLRRMSLPSSFAAKKFEDEDSINDAYASSKKSGSQQVRAPRGSLGGDKKKKKEKTANKYGVKMGYGFDAGSSKESDSESDATPKTENQNEAPAAAEDADEAVIEAPALGEFLEKTNELPNRILGGRSLGSGTKSSNEDIMGIGPSAAAPAAKGRSSWMDREKATSMYLKGIPVEATAQGDVALEAERRGSLAEHLSGSSQHSNGKNSSDLKSLSGVSCFTGYSFGSDNTSSSSELLLSPMKKGPTRASAPQLRLDKALQSNALQRSSLHTGASDETSSFAAFSRSSCGESSISSNEEEMRRRSYTLAILKASGQAA